MSTILYNWNTEVSTGYSYYFIGIYTICGVFLNVAAPTVIQLHGNANTTFFFFFFKFSNECLAFVAVEKLLQTRSHVSSQTKK